MTTLAGHIKSKSQTVYTYLGLRCASCCPSIGRRKRETSILCRMAQGWKTQPSIAGSFGDWASSRRPSHSTTQRIHRSFTRCRRRCLIGPSCIPSKLLRRRSSRGSMSSSSQAIAGSTVARRPILLNLSPKRTSVLGQCQLQRERTQTIAWAHLWRPSRTVPPSLPLFAMTSVMICRRPSPRKTSIVLPLPTIKRS